MTADVQDVISRLRAAPEPLGIAVSGGSDSVGLMVMAATAGVSARIVTVDHGLRPEARGEAEGVAAQAEALGYDHDILEWTGWDGQGNLMAEARKARQGLIGAWAQAHGIECVALGHTQDDQAETVLMRLGRAAGVDGLAAMSDWREAPWGHWWRPMLDLPRQDIRDWLTARRISWIDDPSNDSDKFARVRIRKAIPLLDELGISAEALARVAEYQQDAQDALDRFTANEARKIAATEGAGVVLQAAPLWELPRDIRRRLILAALRWVAGGAYGPRSDAIEGALMRLAQNEPVTLAGCALRPRQGGIAIFREFNVVKGVSSPFCGPWDDLWCAKTEAPEADAEIRALGPEGMRQLPEGRQDQRLYAAMISEPAIWQNDRLIAAPMAGWANGWQICRHSGPDDFVESILSH